MSMWMQPYSVSKNPNQPHLPTESDNSSADISTVRRRNGRCNNRSTNEYDFFSKSITHQQHLFPAKNGATLPVFSLTSQMSTWKTFIGDAVCRRVWIGRAKWMTTFKAFSRHSVSLSGKAAANVRQLKTSVVNRRCGSYANVSSSKGMRSHATQSIQNLFSSLLFGRRRLDYKRRLKNVRGSPDWLRVLDMILETKFYRYIYFLVTNY